MASKSADDKSGLDQSKSGFYCEVCDCVVKDSLNYLDHVNDSTLEEVKEMLERKKRERDEKLLNPHGLKNPYEDEEEEENEEGHGGEDELEDEEDE